MGHSSQAPFPVARGGPSPPAAGAECGDPALGRDDFMRWVWAAEQLLQPPGGVGAAVTVHTPVEALRPDCGRQGRALTGSREGKPPCYY